MKQYPKRQLSCKWKLSFKKKNLKENEFACLFSDFYSKAIFAREEKKGYLALLLSDIFGFPVLEEDLTFYKNVVGIDNMNDIAFQCDIVVFYKDILLILEFNSSRDLTYIMRNQLYQGLFHYQFLLAKKEKKIKKVHKVCLINFNNFYNRSNEVLMDYSNNRNEVDQTYTGNLQIVDIYLPIALKKYYNDGIKKEELSKLELLVIACYIGNIDKARKFLEGDDDLMCIIEDLLQVSHSKDAENYYHSVEDAKYKGISIGEKRGRTLGLEEGQEKAYMEMMRQLQELNVSPEIMKQLKKPKELKKSKNQRQHKK